MFGCVYISECVCSCMCVHVCVCVCVFMPDAGSANDPTGQELCGLVQMRQDPSSCDQDPSSHDQDPSSRDQDPSSRDQDPSSCDQDPSSRDKHERADMVFWHATVDSECHSKQFLMGLLVGSGECKFSLSFSISVFV